MSPPLLRLEYEIRTKSGETLESSASRGPLATIVPRKARMTSGGATNKRNTRESVCCCAAAFIATTNSAIDATAATAEAPVSHSGRRRRGKIASASTHKIAEGNATTAPMTRRSLGPK